MSGSDRQAEVSKPKVHDPEAPVEEKLFEDAVKELTASIRSEDVTGGLKKLDDKIYQLDLGPAAADKVISDVFAELKKNGELPNLVSGFYAENKERLFLDGKSYLDVASLDKRLPGGGVYDLNRAERHVAAFIADNAKTIAASEYNITYSDDQMSDGDFAKYAKQQNDQFNRFNMAQKVAKHFGSQNTFDLLDGAGDQKKDGTVQLWEVNAAIKMNNWMASFTSDQKAKAEAQDRQQALEYLSEKWNEVKGSSFGLSRDELALYLAGEADPRIAQVLDTNSRLFVGNPGTEAYQRAVAEEGYTGSQSKFNSDFIAMRMKEGMSSEEAMRELNRTTELSGFRADVIQRYLNDNQEALGASRTKEVTKESLQQLKERKLADGKLREVEILENAINRFESIANSVSESRWFTDKTIRPNDLEAYAAKEKTARETANLAARMHSLAYKNIHELSGENQQKKPYDIKVPWSKIDTMRNFYEGAGSDTTKFTSQQIAHHKEMKELCDYLLKNYKTAPTRGSSSGYNFDLSKSYYDQQNKNKHNLDRFDAPKVQERAKPVVAENPQPVPVKVEQPKEEVKQKEEVQAPRVEEQPAAVVATQVAETPVAETQVAETQVAETQEEVSAGAEKLVEDIPETRPPINPVVDLYKPKNLYDFTGDGDTRIAEQPVGFSLPRAERPLSPQEFDSGEPVTPSELPIQQLEKPAIVDRLAESEFAKLKEAFQFDENSYKNALRQAARENKPIVLIGATKNTSAEFLKASAAQAASNDKAIYVFVDLERANPDLPITKYLETSIAQRNQANNQNDDNWLSVFKVSSDGRGGVVNHSPEYFNTGAKASSSESVQRAIEVAANKATPQFRAYSNQNAAYRYEQQCRPATNYYSSNCRPRRGVFGRRR